MPLILLSLAVTVGLLTLLGNRAVQLPAVIGGGTNGVLLAAFLPIPLVVTINYGLSSRDRLNERIALRPVSRWDAALVVATLLVLALSVTLVGLLTTAEPIGFIRNALLLTGVAVGIGSVATPAAGSTGVVAIVVLTNSVGPAVSGASYVRLMQSPPHNVWAWSVAATVLIIGLVVLATGVRISSWSAGSDQGVR
ncbi:hypothetical protein [Micromonospora sp. NBC_01813]|uniref:hypothetical protein n=1 Tax=Micromonospora sp. NBC_01813 TaxID=2975988 RepID=UPI002DD868E5|nr:hypothetical protein [Micromonospora sp. NBC_01813]WSA08018.1 hypothetical protein OG958_28010 [Micromonospora sp. NBC_01813]